MKSDGYNYLLKYIEELQSKGRYSFTYDEIEKHFGLGYSSLRKALMRLAKKKNHPGQKSVLHYYSSGV
jgi:DNA-binding GntR family transcriptional regulator